MSTLHTLNNYISTLTSRINFISTQRVWKIYYSVYIFLSTIIVAVTEGPVREEQLLHDMCLLGAVTVEITQILTRAGFTDVSISEPLLR